LKRPLQKTKKYFAALLLFESFSIGTFCAQDMFLLYIFMEATIIPLYLMMLNRPNPAHDAIFQYLLYTIISAFLILIALIMINLETKTTNLTDLYRIGIKNKTIFWLLITGIGIKMPIWPFYHWLPIVHVKSQTVCSIILAAIVLKFATLLVLRLVEPIFGEILISNRGVLIFILIISMSFATAQLMFQDDVKSIFAYFSIIHLNLYFMILLSGTETKYYIFSVIYHSIAVAILFFVAEMIKRVFNTRLIEIIKTQSTKFYGINKIVAAAFFILIAAPFSWGFICEIIAISSIVKISLPCTFIISGIILLSTCYAITTYVRGFGTNKKNTQFNELQKFHINDNYKKTVLYALFGLIITFGLRPTLFLNFF
jgi:NADH-quinone oxidoreductase subunit M